MSMDLEAAPAKEMITASLNRVSELKAKFEGFFLTNQPLDNVKVRPHLYRERPNQ